MRPVPDLGSEATKRRQALELAERRLDHLPSVALDRRPGRRSRIGELTRIDHRQHVAGEREHRVLAVACSGQVLEPRRLQPLEAGVGEVGELVVVAGEDDRVPGKVRRAPIVVEVVEVGEQKRRASGVDDRAGGLPRLLGPLEGPQAERQAGELDELLLEPRDAPVGEPRRRLAVDRHVVEADTGAEPERHLLGDLHPVEGEHVPQRGRAAVVSRPMPVAGHHRGAHCAACRSRRYSARALKLARISSVNSARNSSRYVESVSIATAK
jgi:hypothetical protein